MGSAKKVSLIGGSFVLVAAVVACVVVLVANKSGDDGDGSGPTGGGGGVTVSSKDIKDICQPTDYRQTCEEELSKSSGGKTDIKNLVKTSLNVTIDHVRRVINESDVIQALYKDPTLESPLAACKELFEYAVEDLQAAVDHVLQYSLDDLDRAVYELMVWISAANTYQYTCIDQFANQTCDAAVHMKNALNRSMELTANALRITRNVGDMISEFKLPSVAAAAADVDDDSGSKRRLLEAKRGGSGSGDGSGAPSWVSPEKRRLLAMTPLQLKPTVVVAQDGSGQFKTITEAIASLPRKNKDYVVVYVKAGVYKEKTVTVDSQLNKLVLIGDGPTKTRITGDLNFGRMGISTFHTATFAVVGDDFMVRDFGFENSAGPEGHQAVAFRCQSERSIMYNCHFDGYQDTLYAQSKTQYYRDCTITGTIDFIFGNSYSVFQNCLIIARKPLNNQQNIVTAHGSLTKDETTVYVIHNSTIAADPALVPIAAQHPTFLGRPWKPFARTIYLQSQIDGFVHVNGWMPWDGEPDSIKTCFYAEIDCRGPGADKAGRVKWPGLKNLNLDNAKRYTLDRAYTGIGAEWVKSSGAPFFTGLLQMKMPPNAVQPVLDQPSNMPMNQEHQATVIQPVAGQVKEVEPNPPTVDVSIAIQGGGGGGGDGHDKKKKKGKDKEKKKGKDNGKVKNKGKGGEKVKSN